MFFSYNSSIIVSNGQQPPVTSSRQLLIKFIQSNYRLILQSFAKKMLRCAIDCCSFFLFIFSTEFRLSAMFVYNKAGIPRRRRRRRHRHGHPRDDVDKDVGVGVVVVECQLNE